MTSPTGTSTSNDRAARSLARAFTLVELIVVMALIGMMMALAAPSLSRSLRGRNLDQEAKRFIAATEYARNEAISQGVPMTVWIDAENGKFGVEPKAGFPATQNRTKEFHLNADVHFDMGNGAASAGTAGGSGGGTIQAAEFEPDGTPDPTSIASLRVADRFNSVIAVAKTRDGWGYEIVKGDAQ